MLAVLPSDHSRRERVCKIDYGTELSKSIAWRTRASRAPDFLEPYRPTDVFDVHDRSNRIKRFLVATFFGLSLALLGTAPGGAQSSVSATYGFLTHAAFFSLESKQMNLVDPQMFVTDPAAVAATGPQGIPHAAGVRPAFGVDDPGKPALEAHGRSLNFSLGQWFGARGSVTLAPTGGTTNASFRFDGLVRGGRYSLFENHFSDVGVTFTPLDGSGTTNSFTAGPDGAAAIQVTIPGAVTHAEGLLLVYHSDGHDHGMQRGVIGVDAHHQLIVRVP